MCPASVWGWNIMSRSERDHRLLHPPAPAGAVTGLPGGAAARRAPGLADPSGSRCCIRAGVACSVSAGGRPSLRRRWWRARDAWVRGRLPRRRLSNGAELAGGRCTMSHSGAFYVIKAMEGDAAGGRRGVPGRRATDHRDPAADHADGSMFSLVQRVLAVVRRNIGGAQGRTGRGRHRLGGAAPTD